MVTLQVYKCTRLTGEICFTQFCCKKRGQSMVLYHEFSFFSNRGILGPCELLLHILSLFSLSHCTPVSFGITGKTPLGIYCAGAVCIIFPFYTSHSSMLWHKASRSHAHHLHLAQGEKSPRIFLPENIKIWQVQTDEFCNEQICSSCPDFPQRRKQNIYIFYMLVFFLINYLLVICFMWH